MEGEKSTETTINKKISVKQTPFFDTELKANRKVIDSDSFVHKFKGVTRFGLGDQRVMKNAREIINNRDNSEIEEFRLLNYSNGKLFDKPIVLSENGSDDIILPIGECKKGSLILIHNHPNSTAFSHADFVTLNDNPEIRTIIAVGHNGTVYQMSVGNGKRLDITSEEAYNFYNRA